MTEEAVDYEESIKESITSLMYDTSKLDKVFDTTESHRAKIVTKIMAAVDEVVIDPNKMKGMELESKLSVLRMGMDVLGDVNKQQMSRVKLKSQLNTDQTEQDTANAIADMFNKITEMKLTFTEGDTDEKLSDVLEERGIEISDTELRIDSTDLD